uniref:VWFA domain-containing protein n=1 Tax=Denticeps clupeoides TaxID=299321 RepID=A0AAY4AMG4_9TELE
HGDTTKCVLCLESPTHALRADADPSALSATATYITLAEEHTYDRHLEIILHLSEPHSPLVILEKGRLNFGQYEQQIIARRDFIRCARKDADCCSFQLEFVRKRYHKDILCNPVLMLNFCPDLQTDPPELQRASRELLFLIDRSSSMTEGMLVAIKSLPPAATVNIVSFASTIKTLFTCSKPCSNVCVCIYLSPHMGSTNLLSALAWVYQHPAHRSCPRQIFILTDSSDSGVGKVLELVRRNTCAARCFGLGLGPQACRRLLLGVARMTGGNTEFLDEEERLQPKLIKCLKKALEPALTDVRIDWYVPDNMEALLSPNEIPPLYPGNCLVGYCTLYNVSAFRSRKNEVIALDSCSDVLRRIEQASYIQKQYVLTRCSLSSERGLPSSSPTSDSPAPALDTGSLPQGLERMSQKQSRSCPSFSQKHQYVVYINQTLNLRVYTARYALNYVHSYNLLASYAHILTPFTVCTFMLLCIHCPFLPDGLLFPASPLDWDSFADPESLFSAASAEQTQCRSLIHGLLGGRPVSWEVTVDLSPLWTPEEPQTAPETWTEIVHHLTARSVIRDYENMAEKESDIEHGECSLIDFLSLLSLFHSRMHGMCAYELFLNLSPSGTERATTPADGNFFYCFIHPPVLWKDCVSGLGTVPTPAVHLQLASGAFCLTESYSECIQIPLERLKRASPYTSHRSSLSPPFCSTSPPRPDHDTALSDPLSSEEGSHEQLGGGPQADSGRGSETDIFERSSLDAVEQSDEQLTQLDVEGSSWATAVALAWLEHRCAGFFVEWELIAAKADFWLRCQQLPEGLDLAGLKAAARQLFLLLRHWDENIQLNMLCYNPNNM